MDRHALIKDRAPQGLGRVFRLCSTLIVAIAAMSAFAQQQVPTELETTLKNMLAALQTNSPEQFVADGDAGFKAGMARQMFASVSAQFGPRLAQGYVTTFLGTLNQQGYTVYLWKLVFKDGRDDLLVTMAVRDGKVAAFFLR